MRRSAWVGTVVACAVPGGIGFWRHYESEARASAAETAAGTGTASVATKAAPAEARALAEEVKRLRQRLDRQDTEREQANSPPSEPSSEDGAAELAEPGPQLSELEVHERRVQTYSDALAAEVRDGQAAAAFEGKLMDAVNTSGHGVVESIDCRSTLCSLEIRHNDASGRNRFPELMLGAIRYGAYDYPVEDGKKTIAFIGMPDHPLPHFNPNATSEPAVEERE